MRSRGTFVAGDPRTVACAKKARQVSPWGRIPYNRNAKRTMRLALIEKLARKP